MPKPLGIMLRTWNRLIDLMTGFSDGEADPVPEMQTSARPSTQRATVG
jgi:hypothetical protein